MTPAELLSVEWFGTMEVHIKPPSNVEHTCTKGSCRMLDYLVVSSIMFPLIKSVLAVSDVPWEPHYGLEVELTTEPASVWIRSLDAVPAFESPGETQPWKPSFLWLMT